MQGQRRSPVSLRWLWLWILTPVVVFAGIQIYHRRDELGPPVHQTIYNWVNSAQSGIATARAPTPLPTENPSSKLALAERGWREGRIEAAVDNYQAVLAATPNDVQVHYAVTFGLLMSGRYQQALEVAEETVTADPFSADAWAVRAMALDRMDRYGEAIASALRALDLDPNHARALAFMAEAYLDNQDFELARSTIERALEIAPESFEALRVRGLVAQYIDFDRITAKDYYQQAYDRAPNLPYLAIDLANVLAFSQQNYDDAIAIVGDIVELNPNNSLALFALGNYYNYGPGNFTLASETLTRCVEANPDSISCNGLLGRVQMSLNNYPNAIQYLQRAIDLGSANSYHYFWMGRAQKAQGQCGSAIPFLQKSLSMAQEQFVSDVIVASEDLLRECQAPVGGEIASTPEATAETESS
jgi:tetratricopeptide (TPR) repeat protein